MSRRQGYEWTDGVRYFWAPPPPRFARLRQRLWRLRVVWDWAARPYRRWKWRNWTQLGYTDDRGEDHEGTRER